MKALPTLLVLAEPQTLHPHSENEALGVYSQLDSTLRRGLATGLPVMLVAPEDIATCARNILPSNDVLSMPAPGHTGRSQVDQLASAIATGVMASSQANGWIILPADMPMLRVDTLRDVAQAVASNAVVFPQFKHRRGHPMGFSAELFSELIRLRFERDIAKLVARYPATAVNVDDPGILMVQDNLSGSALYHLRVQLLGSDVPGLRLQPARH